MVVWLHKANALEVPVMLRPPCHWRYNSKVRIGKAQEGWDFMATTCEEKYQIVGKRMLQKSYIVEGTVIICLATQFLI